MGFSLRKIVHKIEKAVRKPLKIAAVVGAAIYAGPTIFKAVGSAGSSILGTMSASRLAQRRSSGVQGIAQEPVNNIIYNIPYSPTGNVVPPDYGSSYESPSYGGGIYNTADAVTGRTTATTNRTFILAGIGAFIILILFFILRR